MYWFNAWAWGIPLIVLTVLVHTLALFSMRYRMVPALARYYDDEHFSVLFALAMSAAVLCVTVLLALEAALWAGVYVAIGAQHDMAPAMLYSLEAMTTFGHADVYLTARWQFLGALEALNGVILIGLTTAFIFSLLRGAELRRKQMR
jgi:hypothetical protein